MSTISHSRPASAKRFPVLDKYFRREEQESLVGSDLEAGRHVGWLLVGVIAGGSSLGIMAVVLMMLFR